MTSATRAPAGSWADAGDQRDKGASIIVASTLRRLDIADCLRCRTNTVDPPVVPAAAIEPDRSGQISHESIALSPVHHDPSGIAGARLSGRTFGANASTMRGATPKPGKPLCGSPVTALAAARGDCLSAFGSHCACARPSACGKTRRRRECWPTHRRTEWQKTQCGSAPWTQVRADCAEATTSAGVRQRARVSANAVKC
jgi:hypothetical protein